MKFNWLTETDIEMQQLPVIALIISVDNELFLHEKIDFVKGSKILLKIWK